MTYTLPSKAEMITRIREAITAGELQCQQEGFVRNDGCSYTGPCVIGVCMPPEVREEVERAFANDDTAITYLVQEGAIIAPKDMTLDWLSSLQGAHDRGEVTEILQLLNQ